MSNASIEDLLRYEEEPRRERRDQSFRLWLGKTLLYAAAIAAFTVLAARTIGVGLPYPVVFGALLALLVLQRVLSDVAPGPSGPEQPGRSGEDSWQVNWPSPDGLFAAASRWDNRLTWTQSDAGRFARNVQPLIAELADERLRQRHGLTRESDPARARELLGEPLWTFLATPVTRPPTPRDIAAVASELEKL